MTGENLCINENPYFINNLLYTLIQKSPRGSYHYKAEENYSPQATFFRKSILIIRKGEGNHGLRNYCTGKTIRISC